MPVNVCPLCLLNPNSPNCCHDWSSPIRPGFACCWDKENGVMTGHFDSDWTETTSFDVNLNPITPPVTRVWHLDFDWQIDKNHYNAVPGTPDLCGEWHLLQAPVNNGSSGGIVSNIHLICNGTDYSAVVPTDGGSFIAIVINYEGGGFWSWTLEFRIIGAASINSYGSNFTSPFWFNWVSPFPALPANGDCLGLSAPNASIPGTFGDYFEATGLMSAHSGSSLMDLTYGDAWCCHTGNSTLGTLPEIDCYAMDVAGPPNSAPDCECTDCCQAGDGAGLCCFDTRALDFTATLTLDFTLYNPEDLAWNPLTQAQWDAMTQGEWDSMLQAAACGVRCVCPVHTVSVTFVWDMKSGFWKNNANGCGAELFTGTTFGPKDVGANKWQKIWFQNNQNQVLTATITEDGNPVLVDGGHVVGFTPTSGIAVDYSGAYPNEWGLASGTFIYSTPTVGIQYVPTLGDLGAGDCTGVSHSVPSTCVHMVSSTDEYYMDVVETFSLAVNANICSDDGEGGCTTGGGGAKPLGLGSLIKKATTAFGIKPCVGCKRRADTLDKLLPNIFHPFGGKEK